MPDPITALAIGSVGSAAVGADAAGDATDAQIDASNAGIAEQRAGRQAFEQRTEPFRQVGLSVAAPLLQSLGIQIPQSLLASSYGGYYGPATTDLQAQLSEIDQQIAGFEPVKTISARLPFGSNEITARQGNESVLADLSNRRTDLQRQLEEAQAAEARGTELAPQTARAVPGSGDSLLSQANPLVSFLRDEGFNQIQESAAAQGNLRSGGTLQDLTRFNTNIASTVVPQLQQQRFNQLFNLLGLGQNAATGQGSAALSTASNIGTLLGQQGQAAAQGQIGQAQAVQGGISDLAGIIGLNSIRPPSDPFGTAQSGYGFNPQSDPFSFGGF